MVAMPLLMDPPCRPMQVTTCRISPSGSSQCQEGIMLKENQDSFATGCCDVFGYSCFTQCQGQHNA